MTSRRELREASESSRKAQRASTKQKAARRPLAASAAARGFPTVPVVVGASAAILGLVGGFVWGHSASADNWEASASGNISFAEMELPDGWVAEKADTDAGTQFSDRNPIPAQSGSCTLTRNTFYLPENLAGRGSEYLSTDQMYLSVVPRPALDSADTNGMTLTDTSVTIDGSQTDAVGLAWDSGQVVVRVFDGGVHEVPEDVAEATPGSIPTQLDSGIPAVAISHSCADPSEFNLDESDELVSSVTIESGI